jgi:hypothetical protein
MKSRKPKKPQNPIIAAHHRFLREVQRPVEKVSDNDVVAAALAMKYDEATLRKAVTMSAAVNREAWLDQQKKALA